MLTTGRDRRTSSTGLKERRAWHAPALGIVTVCLLTIPGLGGSQPSGEGLIAETSSMRSSRLPILFVPNRGQTDSRVQYYAKGPGFGFYFTPEEAVLRFVELSPDREALEIVPSLSLAELAPREGPVAKGVALALRFLGANPEVELEGRREATEKVSYFIGNDPEKWRAGLPTYHEMVYRGVWPQVDGHFRVESGQLKYEFVVHPGGNVNAIRLAYRGADGLSLDEAGNLRIETRLGVLSDQAPRSYQEIDGERVVLATRYLLERSAGGESTIRFAVDGKPDPLRPIVIDPGLAYSTFLGGISRDAALAGISVDAQGFAYVAGYADSVDFPTTVGAFDTMPNGDRDIFVAKILPDGSDLVYSTFIGGNLEDQPWGMTLDASGNVYLTGHTASSDFPTTAGAFDTTYNGVGFLNVFVTKLDGAGNALAYSTFLGGSTLDQGQGVAVDSAGFAYVTGWTCSPTFPTTPGAFSTVHDAVIDAFAAKLDPSGATLVYSTFIGGDAIDVRAGHRRRLGR